MMRLICLMPLLLLTACATQVEVPPAKSGESPIAIVIHGGAGTIRKIDLSDAQEREYRAKLSEALRAGHAVLAQGGSSLDAVVAAITILEDSPLFNAGKGAVFNNAGGHELDASIMEGRHLNAGAVAGVMHVRNPILLARLVMEDSPHVMMAGQGAEEFAKGYGLEFVEQEYFFTQRRYDQLMEAQKRQPKASAPVEYRIPHHDTLYSTVGALALDRDGNLAAATSTGGMTNKRFGRIGDSPVIGAGTYADNRACAASGTGHGEYFIRSNATYSVCARVRFEGMSLAEAAAASVADIGAMGGTGGIIALDADGNIAMPFNTEGMYRGSIDIDGNLKISIYK